MLVADGVIESERPKYGVELEPEHTFELVDGQPVTKIIEQPAGSDWECALESLHPSSTEPIVSPSPLEHSNGYEECGGLTSQNLDAWREHVPADCYPKPDSSQLEYQGGQTIVQPTVYNSNSTITAWRRRLHYNYNSELVRIYASEYALTRLANTGFADSSSKTVNLGLFLDNTGVSESQMLKPGLPPAALEPSTRSESMVYYIGNPEHIETLYPELISSVQSEEPKFDLNDPQLLAVHYAVMNNDVLERIKDKRWFNYRSIPNDFASTPDQPKVVLNTFVGPGQRDQSDPEETLTCAETWKSCTSWTFFRTLNSDTYDGVQFEVNFFDQGGSSGAEGYNLGNFYDLCFYILWTDRDNKCRKGRFDKYVPEFGVGKSKGKSIFFSTNGSHSLDFTENANNSLWHAWLLIHLMNQPGRTSFLVDDAIDVQGMANFGIYSEPMGRPKGPVKTSTETFGNEIVTTYSRKYERGTIRFEDGCPLYVRESGPGILDSVCPQLAIRADDVDALNSPGEIKVRVSFFDKSKPGPEIGNRWPVEIDWGDSTGNTVSGTVGVGIPFVPASNHKYTDDGTFTITATIAGLGSATTTVTIPRP
jgi:hypothetical protein